MFISLAQYVVSLCAPVHTMQRLSHLVPCRHADGRLCCMTGNSAAVFKVESHGRYMALRCYLRPKHNLEAIYGSRYYPDEMLVASEAGEYMRVGVVLDEWREGMTLRRAIELHHANSEYMSGLLRGVERLGAELLAAPWVHGDIKCENIIVAPDLSLHLIDFDATINEAVDLSLYDECGTRAYTHPLRDVKRDAAHLDDYPLAILVTNLAALCHDATLYERYATDGLVVDSTVAMGGASQPYDEVLALFERVGDYRHAHIARLLTSREPHLPNLVKLLMAVEGENSLCGV